jgi:NhaC family Na+:H+ antiporter
MLKTSLETELPRPSLVLSLLPPLVLVMMLAVNVVIYSDDATYGPNQIALILAAAVAAMVGWSLKIPFSKMLTGIHNSLGAALPAILILLMIGALSGTWMLSGIVPTMVYYGLAILEPSYFLVAAAVICSIVSIATGSSWSTVATVGVALIGIGNALGAPDAMTAGAIISGAYFGDKLSPLSDTTNLAAAMAGTNIVTHIRYMLWTTVPSMLITLSLFWYLGSTIDAQGVDQADVTALSNLIAEKFTISPWLFAVPAIVIGLVVCKIDALIALFVGALLGGVAAVIAQPEIVANVATNVDLPKSLQNTPGVVWLFESYSAITNSMFGEIDLAAELTEAEVAANGSKNLDSLTATSRARVFASKLLSAGGMNGMLNTIWLIICAMCFGGVMEACGLLKRITDSLVGFAKSTGSLIATTASTCLFLNFTASDQYLAIVVPGRMFRETYEDRGLAPENLSRTLEDSGTVTSVLVPWNTCGAVQATVLGVATIDYAGYSFFNYISPLMTIAIGFAGIEIAKLATMKTKVN